MATKKTSFDDDEDDWEFDRFDDIFGGNSQSERNQFHRDMDTFRREVMEELQEKLRALSDPNAIGAVQIICLGNAPEKAKAAFKQDLLDGKIDIPQDLLDHIQPHGLTKAHVIDAMLRSLDSEEAVILKKKEGPSFDA